MLIITITVCYCYMFENGTHLTQLIVKCAFFLSVLLTIIIAFKEIQSKKK